MKKQGHPGYKDVLFVDTATGFKFVCGSTIQSDKQETYQGKSLPVVTLSISSSSHPYFVGGKQFVDTEGRVDKFKKRYETKKQPEAQSTPIAEHEIKGPAKTKKK